ncbi:MAG: DNA-processing protein DprA [Hyphomicrobiales bacterium]
MNAPRRLSDAERVSWVRLARSSQIGAVTFQNLLARYGTAAAALEAVPDLARRGGSRKPFVLYSQTQAEDELATARSIKAELVVPGERGYPPMLRHIHGAPPLLCVAGNLDLADADCVGIVGARTASAIGLKFTRMISGLLAQNHILVASGLARGIDTAAHEAALAAGTAAVLAGGIDHIYPPENAKLHQQIAEQGLLISEMPPGTVPKAEYFPRRNRIISGMSRAIVVVEAALRSGSLITARFAAEQGRDVFAVPGSPLDPRCEGCNRLIKDGAQLVTSPQDVLESLRMVPRPSGALFLEPAPDRPPHDDVSDDDRAHLLSFLSPTETHIDDLIRESRLSAETVMAILLELEIAGRVLRTGGGRISLTDFL